MRPRNSRPSKVTKAATANNSKETPTFLDQESPGQLHNMSVTDTSRLAARMGDPDQPLKPFFSYHPGDTLFLIVGEEQEQFLVHSTYLTVRSEFFRAALSKHWKEGQSRVIKLPEDDPTTVAQYLDFVYKDMLPTLHG
jgi:hypothetical protein